MSVLVSIFTALLVVVIFNLMIIVHEVGHFLAARWRGMVVEEFGIWFGKPLIKKKIRGVWYSLGCIPFGGFVKLPQMADMSAVEGKTETPKGELPPVTPLSRIIVAFAGPLFSFLLALSFAVVVWKVGRPVSEAEETTTIGYVDPDSPLMTTEPPIKPGDVIESIDGHPVRRWSGMGKETVLWRIVASEGAKTDPIDLIVKRGDKEIEVHPVPVVQERKSWFLRKSLRQLLIGPKSTPVVAEVTKDSPAAEAGILPKDRITAVNGEPIYDDGGVSEYAANHPGEPLVLTLKRPVGNDAFSTIESKPLAERAPIIDTIEKGGPADAAGLKAGDSITAVDGQHIVSVKQVTDSIHAAESKPIGLDVMRDGKPMSLSVTPRLAEVDGAKKAGYFIGLMWRNPFGFRLDPRGVTHLQWPTPAEEIRKSAGTILDTLEALTSRKNGIGIQQMGGAVMMARVYWNYLQIDDGWRYVLWFSVVLNVNLAILNMLPIPPLDGSHILLSTVEAIRRRPANAAALRAIEFVQTACTLVIIAFMLYIAFLDVGDWVAGGGGHKMKFISKEATPEQNR